MYEFFTESIFGLSAGTVNWVVTGIIALLVLLILYFLYRLISRPRLASGRRSKQARLAITDAAVVDERRRLVLVRRDDIEHLVMIGGAADIVVESNIRKNAPARPLANQAAPATAAAAPSPATPPKRQPTAVPPRAATTSVAPPARPATASPEVQSPVSSSVTPVVAAAGAAVAATSSIASDAASSAKDAAENASDLIAEKSKTSVGDDMDALLSEITTNK